MRKTVVLLPAFNIKCVLPVREVANRIQDIFVLR